MTHNTMLQVVIQTRRANNSVDYIACLEFMFRLFLKKNRGVTVIHMYTPQLSGIIKSIIRSNIYMVMFLKHQND